MCTEKNILSDDVYMGKSSNYLIHIINRLIYRTGEFVVIVMLLP